MTKCNTTKKGRLGLNFSRKQAGRGNNGKSFIADRFIKPVLYCRLPNIKHISLVIKLTPSFITSRDEENYVHTVNMSLPKRGKGKQVTPFTIFHLYVAYDNPNIKGDTHRHIEIDLRFLAIKLMLTKNSYVTFHMRA